MEEQVVTSRHGRWWRFVPLILWICVIFYSSTGNASMSHTSRFLRPLLEQIFSSENTIYWANVIIRKIAHLTYYALLGGFSAYALIDAPLNWLKKNWFCLSLIFVYLIATADEYHQSLVPSRVGSVIDVLLDCIGGLAVILAGYFLVKLKRKKA